MSVTNVIISLK